MLKSSNIEVFLAFHNICDTFLLHFSERPANAFLARFTNGFYKHHVYDL
jgi:hypothetical protein